MQMNLFFFFLLLELRAASSSDAVKPTPCARIGFWTRGRGGGSSLLGSAFSPVRGFDFPCTGVSLPLYGQDNFPFMGVEGKQTNENENEGPPYR